MDECKNEAIINLERCGIRGRKGVYCRIGDGLKEGDTVGETRGSDVILGVRILTSSPAEGTFPATTSNYCSDKGSEP